MRLPCTVSAGKDAIPAGTGGGPAGKDATPVRKLAIET